MQVLPFSEINQIPNDCMIIGSEISGGDFRSYLHEKMQEANGNIYLLLEPCFRIFPLPCADGQGAPLSKARLQDILLTHKSSFSGSLCTNFIFLPEDPSVILFDDSAAMEEKIKLARSLNYRGIIKKNKTP